MGHESKQHPPTWGGVRGVVTFQGLRLWLEDGLYFFRVLQTWVFLQHSPEQLGLVFWGANRGRKGAVGLQNATGVFGLGEGGAAGVGEVLEDGSRAVTLDLPWASGTITLQYPWKRRRLVSTAAIVRGAIQRNPNLWCCPLYTREGSQGQA